ncbi:type II toxin-antitoxin system HicB family antitoxin [Geminocystis sp. CENA526]|uniref:type II toxin-antitoxin system HicB family antitoxin n=1 Tax=Geminocystis sp. CENA526 TaxID=1355871 RepID=UPI003D6F4303
MQYQILIHNKSPENFTASVIGISNLIREGKTEDEAIYKIKLALEELLTTSKLININIDNNIQSYPKKNNYQYAGIFAEDSSFDDFMDKLTLIRQESNLREDD